VTVRRGIVLALPFVSALLLGVGAAQSASRASVTLWIDWTGKFSAYSRLEAVSGTVNRAGSTSTTEVNWHNVVSISVPTPLPPPDKPNQVAFLSLTGLTPDSYLQETHKLCIDGQACTTNGFVNTGDRAGVSGSAVSNYPDPVGTRSVSWEAQLYGLFSFSCGNQKVTPDVEQRWATPTLRQIDLGKIATGPAQGDQWSFAPAPLAGSNPAFACAFRYEWSGNLRISRMKPPAVTPPSSPATSGAPSTGSGKSLAKAAAQDDLETLLPDAAFWCFSRALGTGLVTVGLAGGATLPIAGVGAALFGASAQMCGNLERAIASDILVLRDPPVAGMHLVAHPAPVGSVRLGAGCPHWKGQPGSFCAAWLASEERLVRATSTMQAVFAAWKTTIGRESAALGKGDKAAVALQDRALTALNGKAKAAVSGFATASAAAAQVLRSAGVQVTQSKTQNERVIQVLVADLGRLGVSRSTLQSVAAAELTPAAVDVVSLLGGKRSTPSTAPPPPSPGAGAGAAEAKVLVANSGSNTVTLLSGTGSVLATVPVGAKPWKMAVSPDRRLAYVTESGSDTLALLDLRTDKVAGRITVGKVPTFVLLNRDGSVAYVSNAGSNTISVVKTASRRVVATISTDVEPYALAFSPDGKKLYVANCHYPSDTESSVQVIETSNNAVAATIKGFNCAEGIAVTPRTAYVTNANSGAKSIGLIDTAENRVSGSITVGDGPQCVALSPDRSALYSTSSDGIFVVNTATNKVVRTIAVGAVDCLALSTNGSTLYATSANRNLLFVVNAATGAVLHTVTVAGTPLGVTVR
jgi:YVTN family beta-propeller protein